MLTDTFTLQCHCRPRRSLSSAITLSIAPAGLQRLPGRLRGRAFEAEQRADAVGLDVAQGAAGGADGIAERLDIERQHVQQILRDAGAGKLGAIAEVAEQHDDLVLGAALGGGRPVDRPLRAHQRNDRDVAVRAQLTGEAHAGRRADASERGPLVGLRARADIVARRHAHPAGRAACSPAAHRGMREVEAAARFQHRPPARHAHGAPGIRDGDQAPAAALEQVADRAGAEGRADDGEITREQPLLPLRDRDPLRVIGRAQILQGRRDRGRIAGELASHGDEAQRRERRQQQRGAEQHVTQLPVERPPVEREMQAEAAVQPPRRQQAQLLSLRARRPQIGDHAGIVGRQSEQVVGEPRVGGVTDQQDRQREAERDAQQLGRRQAEGAPLVNRPQREQEMDRERAIEQQRAERAGPELDRELQTFLRGIERDEAERVVEEMQRDIDEENEAGGQPQVPAQSGEGQLRWQRLALHSGSAWGGLAQAQSAVHRCGPVGYGDEPAQTISPLSCPAQAGHPVTTG